MDETVKQSMDIDKTGFSWDEPWKMTDGSLPEHETFLFYLQRIATTAPITAVRPPVQGGRFNASWSFGSVLTAPSVHLTHLRGSSRVVEGCGRSFLTSWGIIGVTSSQQSSVPYAAQAIPFDEFLASGKLPDGYLASEYLAQQFVERLVHYVLSVPTGSYTMAQLGQLLEQINPRAQILFFKRLKETSPESLKDFAPLYYGFMNEFHSLLFT